MECLFIEANFREREGEREGRRERGKERGGRREKIVFIGVIELLKAQSVIQ